MSGNHQCIWSRFGQVSHSSYGLFGFIYAIANENDLSFVKCTCKPSFMEIAAYITAANTEMVPELKILLKTILSSFQTSFVVMMLQTVFFFCLFFFNPNQLLFPSVGISQGAYMLLLQYPLASCASFVFSGVEQKCYLLLKCYYKKKKFS